MTLSITGTAKKTLNSPIQLKIQPSYGFFKMNPTIIPDLCGKYLKCPYQQGIYNLLKYFQSHDLIFLNKLKVIFLLFIINRLI